MIHERLIYRTDFVWYFLFKPFQCKHNYNGENCEFDPCHGVTCQNGGTCYVDGYIENGQEMNEGKCACKGGYNGDNCENDPCTQNPCKNGGRCSLTSGTPIDFRNSEK